MKPNQEDVLRYFRQKKIFQISDVIDFLSCSIATARRRLKEWKTYSSYNKNASFYTLPDVPQFDERGIWQYKGVFFTNQRTLKQTVLVLIENSTAGLTVLEANEILGQSVYNILSPLANQDNLFHREKYHGMYVYYSKDSVVSEKQKQNRKSQYMKLEDYDLPSDADCVTILVELIKHPNYQPEQLSRCVKNKGAFVSIKKVRDLLKYHGLLKKNEN